MLVIALSVLLATSSVKDNDDGTYTLTAEGEMNVPVRFVEAALLDALSFPKWQENVKKVEVLEDKYIHATSEFPFVGMVDHIVEVENTELSDSTGAFKQRWTSVPTKIPEDKDVTRLKVNDGTWEVTPTKTGCKYTYTNRVSVPVHLPGFLISFAMNNTVPGMMDALEKRAKFLEDESKKGSK